MVAEKSTHVELDVHAKTKNSFITLRYWAGLEFKVSDSREFLSY